jgi:transposase
LIRLGHEVKLMPAQYVKPYVKRGKNDAADAEATFRLPMISIAGCSKRRASQRRRNKSLVGARKCVPASFRTDRNPPPYLDGGREDAERSGCPKLNHSTQAYDAWLKQKDALWAALARSGSEVRARRRPRKDVRGNAQSRDAKPRPAKRSNVSAQVTEEEV